jgi:hypothetical protein
MAGGLPDDAERKRRTRRVLLTIVALLGLGLALWKLPGWMIARGGEAASACLSAKQESAEPAGDECDQRIWLLPPLALSWERSAARSTRSTIEANAREHDLVVATSARPNAEQRTRAAERFLAREIAATGSARAERWRARMEQLYALGAFAEIVRADPKSEWQGTFYAARMLHDLNVAHRSAEQPVSGWDRGTQGLRRGAWLCLFGRRESGQQVLLTALGAGSDYDRDEIASALIACGYRGELHPEAFVSKEARLLLGLADPTWQAGRRRSIVREWTRDLGYSRSLVRIQAAALDLTLGPSDSVGLEDAFERISLPDDRLREWAPLSGSMVVDRFWTPGELSGPTTDLRLGDPLDKSSEKLATLAARAQPIASDSKLRSDVRGFATHALDQPGPALRRAAWVLRLEAIAAWAGERRCERALASMKAADELAPDEARWLTLTVLLLCGRPKDVVQRVNELRQAGAAKAAFDSGFMDLTLAQALTKQAKFDEARSAAERAERALAKVPGELPTVSKWLHAALCIKTQRPYTAAPDAPALGALTELARKNNLHIERVLAGKAVSEALSTLPPIPAAAVFLAAEGARDADREVWLDQVIGKRNIEERLLTVVRARRDAATWRADQAAAQRWDEQLRALEAPIVDARTAVLAAYAGL